jgi:glycosyltransferase A (GT-A) superfamily protein (DUF2064 family)
MTTQDKADRVETRELYAWPWDLSIFLRRLPESTNPRRKARLSKAIGHGNAAGIKQMAMLRAIASAFVPVILSPESVCNQSFLEPASPLPAFALENFHHFRSTTAIAVADRFCSLNLMCGNAAKRFGIAQVNPALSPAEVCER